MIVLHLTGCPPSLRGDLTKWLMEIAAGVYVGRVSARVRDMLWEKVVETSKGGRAVLVFNANNEQRMDYRIHGETWEPIDFDGLKLMMRPSPARLEENKIKKQESKQLGFSNAARHRKVKVYTRSRTKSKQIAIPSKTSICDKNEFLSSYVVIDIETTGFNPSLAKITEIGAVKVDEANIINTFQSLVKISEPVPPAIVKLTGITDKMLNEQGKEFHCIAEEFIDFIGNLPIVAHNASFDLSFLNKALRECGFDEINNRVIDTLALAKKMIKGLKSYKLYELALHFNLIDSVNIKNETHNHRSLNDCYMGNLLYQKLMNMI